MSFMEYFQQQQRERENKVKNQEKNTKKQMNTARGVGSMERTQHTHSSKMVKKAEKEEKAALNEMRKHKTAQGTVELQQHRHQKKLDNFYKEEEEKAQREMKSAGKKN